MKDTQVRPKRALGRRAAAHSKYFISYLLCLLCTREWVEVIHQPSCEPAGYCRGLICMEEGPASANRELPGCLLPLWVPLGAEIAYPASLIGQYVNYDMIFYGCR
jgi:hypothetical protein